MAKTVKKDTTYVGPLVKLTGINKSDLEKKYFDADKLKSRNFEKSGLRLIDSTDTKYIKDGEVGIIKNKAVSADTSIPDPMVLNNMLFDFRIRITDTVNDIITKFARGEDPKTISATYTIIVFS